ncbi:hypothetical protein P171DRAFT_444448 [Karstenula rhodostoma CBS 690.94]|uniref:BTB domain-containing protein n=1 Tax=Karstenula rhodostoma CBS 690.94 TaxID=1392251 RepID=A0A9P4PJB8_9PLEO|nr:hypothetical protein P171DRAFT_444448 [Karstenula rhodostoma CBS 690.94]
MNGAEGKSKGEGVRYRGNYKAASALFCLCLHLKGAPSTFVLTNVLLNPIFWRQLQNLPRHPQLNMGQSLERLFKFDSMIDIATANSTDRALYLKKMSSENETPPGTTMGTPMKSADKSSSIKNSSVQCFLDDASSNNTSVATPEDAPMVPAAWTSFVAKQVFDFSDNIVQLKVVDLTDDKAELVHGYITWLYTQKFPMTTVDVGMAEAYVFGEKIMDKKFKNMVLDTMMTKTIPTKRLAAVANCIYKGTVTTSPARLLVARIIAELAQKGDDWNLVFTKLKREPLAAVMKAMVEVRRAPLTQSWLVYKGRYLEEEETILRFRASNICVCLTAGSLAQARYIHDPL